MKKSLYAMGWLIILAACVSCTTVVRPARVNTTYVKPVYPIPGPGYIWRLHPTYGWGWYHPRLGWWRR